MKQGGDGLAQWLESWTADPKVKRSNLARSTRKTEFFQVKKVVLTRCRCAQTCVYTYAYKRPCTHFRDYTHYTSKLKLNEYYPYRHVKFEIHHSYHLATNSLTLNIQLQSVSHASPKDN